MFVENFKKFLVFLIFSFLKDPNAIPVSWIFLSNVTNFSNSIFEALKYVLFFFLCIFFFFFILCLFMYVFLFFFLFFFLWLLLYVCVYNI